MIDHRYTIMKELGKGSYATVLLVKTAAGAFAAAKVFKNPADYSSELGILKKLDSPWTLQILDFNDVGQITGSVPEEPEEVKALRGKTFPYIIMELADNGEFFDYLDISGPVCEKIGRYYFQNLINALEYLHSNGITHRDIKLQNLLLTHDFNIKLADFGLAVTSEAFETKVPYGTLRVHNNSYMPPEAFKRSYTYTEKENGFKADIYAAGVILFNLLTGCMPYSKATQEQDLYVKFERDKEKFWEYHEKYSFEEKVPEDLKKLLNGLLEPSPEKRWDIKTIKASKWYNQETASPKYVTKEMKRRKSSVNLAKEFPEKRVEIAKSWTAKSKGKSKKKQEGKKNRFADISYEKVGTFAWKIYTEIFGY